MSEKHIIVETMVRNGMGFIPKQKSVIGKLTKTKCPTCDHYMYEIKPILTPFLICDNCGLEKSS